VDKHIQDAICDVLKMIAERVNYGISAKHQPSNTSILTLKENKITFDDDFVFQDNEPVYRIERRFANRKIGGMYKELLPNLVPVDQDRFDGNRRNGYSDR